jgi:hypothetical protein
MRFFRMSALISAASLAIPLAVPLSVGAFSYPALDTASHWTLQDWGADPGLGFHVRGASKRVWTAPGQAEEKTVFYDLACVGVELDGIRYPLGSLQYQGQFEGDGYIARYGFFQVTSGPGVAAILYFYDDGKFLLTGFLTGDIVGSIGSWRMLVRADYDLAGSGNDLAEFAWSGASEGRSVSPPQYPAREAADGSLDFVPGGPAYWAASGHEITVAYPPMPSTDHGVENPGFARIFDGDHPRFGLTLWGDAATSVTATFKAYAAFDGNLEPRADVSEILQITDEASAYPRYAVAGRDQMMFLSLGATGPWDACVLSCKLFQRPASRPLAVTVRQHPPEYMGGWVFDPDSPVRVTGDGPRTFRNALAELTGPDDLTVRRSGEDGVLYLPFDGYADPGQAVTEAQLHDLMTATRDYGAASLEDVRGWKMDLFVVDWTLQGEPDVWEAMFDYGDADGNGISREGAAVFWPALAGRGEDWRGRQTVLSALHGAGLALNMFPSWGACPSAGFCWNDASACGGVRCGEACPDGASGCRYEAYDCARECAEGSIMSLTDVDHSTLRFNSSPAAGSDHSEIDWYRRAPEAWAKPGRLGIGPVSGPMPFFYPE